MLKKYIFLDRDGTLIDEPEDKQVDSILKFRLKEHVIPALLMLQKNGYTLVMISNQDGMGSVSFPKSNFDAPQNLLLEIFESQGIYFDSICICPHFESDHCECRKPRLGLVINYIKSGVIDFKNSYVIGDRETDIQFANNIGIKAIQYHDEKNWLEIANAIVMQPRIATLKRITNETDIKLSVNLDHPEIIQISTGLGFLDHMIHQLAKHACFGLKLKVTGDLNVDEHHTVEDTAIALGEALRDAIGDKLGISRYGFLLPMDESCATIAIDLSGRAYFVFAGKFPREKVGDLPTELVSHFFRSLSDSLKAAIHIKVVGENTHHMVESIFKGVGRALRQVICKQGFDLPTTKGVL